MQLAPKKSSTRKNKNSLTDCEFVIDLTLPQNSPKLITQKDLCSSEIRFVYILHLYLYYTPYYQDIKRHKIHHPPSNLLFQPPPNRIKVTGVKIDLKI